MKESCDREKFFTDLADEKFIKIRNALKESDKFAWMPPNMLLYVSY